MGPLIRAAAIAVSALALQAAAAAATPDNILPLSEVRAGQTGYGLSDFGEGRGIQRFDVKILGVLRNISPRQDLILARLSGADVEKAGIVAGMSGSPVYLDGRLAGAVAYGWPFSREPIAGITPIESMLALRSSEAGGRVEVPRPVSVRAIVDAACRGDFAGPFAAMVADRFPAARPVSGWAPLPVPITIPPDVAPDALASRLAGALGLAVGSASAANAEKPRSPRGTDLAPGASVAAILVSGDLDLAATGTVTWNDGRQLLAFGHPFLSLGPVSYPMAASDVVSTFPSLYQSFKFATNGAVLGEIYSDRASGIVGRFGPAPALIPFEMTVTSGESRSAQTYRFRLVEQPLLTPALAAISADSVISWLEKAAGDRTLGWRTTIETDAGTVRLDSVFSGPIAREQASASLGMLTAFLYANEFRPVSIRRITVDVEHFDQVAGEHILEASVAKSRVHPGESVPVDVVLQDYHGGRRTEHFDVPVPPETPAGSLSLLVADGNSATALDFSAFPADPASLSQSLALLDRIRPADSLNVLVYRSASGAVVKGQELPGLPPSVATIVLEPGSADAGPALSQVRVASISRRLRAPVTGSARLTVAVVTRTD